MSPTWGYAPPPQMAWLRPHHCDVAKLYCGVRRGWFCRLRPAGTTAQSSTAWDRWAALLLSRWATWVGTSGQLCGGSGSDILKRPGFVIIWKLMIRFCCLKCMTKFVYAVNLKRKCFDSTIKQANKFHTSLIFQFKLVHVLFDLDPVKLCW